MIEVGCFDHELHCSSQKVPCLLCRSFILEIVFLLCFAASWRLSWNPFLFRRLSLLASDAVRRRFFFLWTLSHWSHWRQAHPSHIYIFGAATGGAEGEKKIHLRSVDDGIEDLGPRLRVDVGYVYYWGLSNPAVAAFVGVGNWWFLWGRCFHVVFGCKKRLSFPTWMTPRCIKIIIRVAAPFSFREVWPFSKDDPTPPHPHRCCIPWWKRRIDRSVGRVAAAELQDRESFPIFN